MAVISSASYGGETKSEFKTHVIVMKIPQFFEILQEKDYQLTEFDTPCCSSICLTAPRTVSTGTIRNLILGSCEGRAIVLDVELPYGSYQSN